MQVHEDLARDGDHRRASAMQRDQGHGSVPSSPQFTAQVPAADPVLPIDVPMKS